MYKKQNKHYDELVLHCSFLINNDKVLCVAMSCKGILACN